MTWTYSGYIRIHFNRKEEAPLLASITNHAHSWEILATLVRIEGATLVSKSDLEHARPGLDPIWWLEGDASITLDDNGIAAIGPYKAPNASAQNGLEDWLPVDMMRGTEAAGMSAGFATALRPAPATIFGLADFIPAKKKRKTRKNTTKRRVR